MAPRIPKREEKASLRQLGFNPKRFLTLSKDFESYTFIEVASGKKLLVRR